MIEYIENIIFFPFLFLSLNFWLVDCLLVLFGKALVCSTFNEKY